MQPLHLSLEKKLPKNNNLLISVEGAGRGGGAGTLADELSMLEGLDAFIFSCVTSTKFDYVINFFTVLWIASRRKKDTKIILFDAMSTFICGLICILLKRRYIVCLHGSEIDEFITKPSRLKKLFLSATVYRYILTYADSLVVPSCVQAQKISDYSSDSQVHVKPWGAPFNQALIDFFLSSYKKRVVVVSRLAKGKNVQEFLKHCLLELNSDTAIAVIGSGPLSGKVSEMCEREKNLFFCGQQPNSVVQHVISNVDVVVAPSTLEEAYGLSLRDALMHGKVCIAANSGAHTEFARFLDIRICSDLTGMVREINSHRTVSSMSSGQLTLIKNRSELIEHLIQN